MMVQSLALRSAYRFAQLFRIQIDLGEQALKGAGKGFVLDVLEALLQGVQQLLVLGARHLGDAAPEVRRLDHIMHLAAHLFFKFVNVVGIAVVPHLQGECVAVCISVIRVIRPQFPLCRGFIIVRQVAQEQEREHVVAEVVRVHGAAQLVGNAPEGIAQLSLVVLWSCVFLASSVSSGNSSGLKV